METSIHRRRRILLHFALGIGLPGLFLGYLAFRGKHERDLLEYATGMLSEVPGLRLIGTAKEKIGVLSFVMDSVHPHDIGTVVDLQGVAIRTGHHCTQPLMQRFGIPATTRASFAFYNTKAEIDRLVSGIHKAKEMLG